MCEGEGGREEKEGERGGGGGADGVQMSCVYPYLITRMHLVVGAHAPADMTPLAGCLCTRP